MVQCLHLLHKPEEKDTLITRRSLYGEVFTGSATSIFISLNVSYHLSNLQKMCKMQCIWQLNKHYTSRLRTRTYCASSIVWPSDYLHFEFSTYATGAACQQRTLTPPDTWSCPNLGLACVLMSRPISPELVLSPDFWISNTPRYFSFAFQLLLQNQMMDLMKLDRDEVFMFPHKFCCFRPDPSRGGANIQSNKHQR